MRTRTKTHEPITEKEVPGAPLEVVHSNPVREKHLEGLSEDEKKVIQQMAHIFVTAILKMSEK